MDDSDTEDGSEMKIRIEWQPSEMKEMAEEKAFCAGHCPSHHMIRVELPLQRRFIFFHRGRVYRCAFGSFVARQKTQMSPRHSITNLHRVNVVRYPSAPC